MPGGKSKIYRSINEWKLRENEKVKPSMLILQCCMWDEFKTSHLSEKEKERERESSRLIKLYDRSGMTRGSDFRGYFGYYTVTSVCFSGTTAYTLPTAARFPQSLPPTPSLTPSRSNLALNGVILEDSSISKKQPVYLRTTNIMHNLFP